MVDVRPLRLRLVHESWAARVSSPAHDALTPADRRAHVAFNPDSYMAVTRGLEDVLPQDGLTAEDLLRQGRSALDRLLQNGAFTPERGDDFYVYRLEAKGISQTALVAGVAVADYIAGDVRIHEHVKAHRAIHLANHLDVVGVQSSPIAMAHRANAAISNATRRATQDAPLVKVTLPDGLTQTVWVVTDESDQLALRSALDGEPLYLIDGHHRAAAAATFRTAAGPGMADWMLAAIFPADELSNAAHHRVLRPSVGVAEALEVMGRRRRLRRCDPAEVNHRAGDEVALYAAGRWYCLTLPYGSDQDELSEAERILANLDPSRFQNQIVDPLFHLDPSGEDPALSYVAGNRTRDDLQSVIDNEGGILAVMREVPVEALMIASDSALIMPPKSTYFEPKVRSGVFLRSTTD